MKHFFISILLGFALLPTMPAQEQSSPAYGRTSPANKPSSSANEQSSSANKTSSPANETSSKQLRIQIEWIELSHKDYTALMEEKNSSHPAGPKSSNDGPLREKLKKMIEEDKAALLDTAMVAVKDGHRAKVESIMEVIYPTEYLAGRKNWTTNSNKIVRETKDNIGGLPVAGDFVTRNVGTTVEVDPTLGVDERMITLSMAPEIIYHAGVDVYGEFKGEESEVHVAVPAFYTMKVTTQVAMMAGEYCLVAAESPLDMDEQRPRRERKVMVFAKTELIQIGY